MAVTAEEQRSVLQAELDRIVSAIIKLGVQKIILFGSLARGDIGRHSDIDLIVVMETEERFLDRLGRVYEAVGLREVGMDVLVYTPDEFDRLRQTRRFVMEAVAEGKVLYEA